MTVATPIRPKVTMTLGHVAQVLDLSPNFRRLRLTGDFRRFLTGGLHFRFMIGPEGVALPVETEAGLDWPGGPEAWHRPPYTVRAMDPLGNWIDIDIFLHAGGRVTNWSAGLKPGDPVGLTGPGGGGTIAADWVGLIGDETALPVILRMIQALPATACGQAFVCVPDPGDVQQVALPHRLRLVWIIGASMEAPVALLDRLMLPPSRRFVFFAGEKAQAEAARLWMARAGLTKDESRAAAYWSR